MYVLVPKDRAETSEEARNFVVDWLTDNGFTAEGHFVNGIADYFVIGGRWSGKLLTLKGNPPRDVDDFSIPFEGHEDDAMIVDEELYQKVIAGNLASDDPGSLYEGGKVIDVEYFENGKDTTPENTIDRKWIVVVDFHY
jgi:hypothetical protein